jgi:hypothetical protein
MSRFYLFSLDKICNSPDGRDNINLSSTHHYPSGKNSGLLFVVRVLLAAEKKNYSSFWSPVS